MMFGPNTFSFTALMALLISIGPVSADLYLVSLSILPDALDTTIEAAQLTMSYYLVAFAVAQLFVGTLSDRFGRKPVLLGGLALFFAASIACALATTIEDLIAFRFVQGLGVGTGAVVCRAVVRDLHEKEQAARVLGYMGTIMGLVPIFGPILGSYLAVRFGWQANFWLMTGYGAVTLALIALLLRESLPLSERAALNPAFIAQNFARLMSHRAFLGYWLAYGLVNGAMFAFFTVASFLIVDLRGVPAQHFGFHFGLIMVGFMVGAFAAGRFSARLGIDSMLVGSLVLATVGAIAGLGLAWMGIDHGAAVIVPIFALMVSVGCAQPLCLASALAPFPDMAGKAASLLGFAQLGFGAAGSFAVGVVHDGTAVPLMAVVAIMAASSLAVYRLLVWAPAASGQPTEAD